MRTKSDNPLPSPFKMLSDFRATLKGFFYFIESLSPLPHILKIKIVGTKVSSPLKLFLEISTPLPSRLSVYKYYFLFYLHFSHKIHLKFSWAYHACQCQIKWANCWVQFRTIGIIGLPLIFLIIIKTSKSVVMHDQLKRIFPNIDQII